MKKTIEQKDRLKDCIDLIGDKWSAIILFALHECGSIRFTECQRMQKINPRTLAARLLFLEKAGLIEKKVYSEYPPRTEYTMTKKGKDLVPVFKQMITWSEKYA